jgi:hypothetical protein
LNTGDRALPNGWRRGDLMPLEEEMRAKAAAGELVDRGEGPFDLAEMQAWDGTRLVRAAVLRYLLVGNEWPVDAKGVRLRGLHISGHLDFEGATLRCPLSLECCYFDAGEPACFDHATVSRLTLTRCYLAAGLTGQMLSAREVDLSGSILSGPLLVRGADIAGDLNCRGAQLNGRDDGGYALVADGLRTGGNVVLDRWSDRRFTANGGVRLVGAAITGQLNWQGAQLTGHYSGGNALTADGVTVGQGVFLNEALISAGAVRLPRADIASDLNCRDAQLTGQDGERYALQAEAMKVGGHVLLDGDFAAAGAVRLSEADIAGQLNCRGARLDGGDDEVIALLAVGVKVGGSVLMERSSTSAGAVRLSGADIGGDLICRGAHLTGQDLAGNALIANGVKVGGDVYLDGEFATTGTILLRSARIGGGVGLFPAVLADQDHVALNAAGAQITGQLVWRPAKEVSGQVNLEGATVGQLEDDWSGERALDGFWPADGRLRLDGFTYRRLGVDQQATVEQRLDWIHSQYRAKQRAQWVWIDTMAPPIVVSAPESAAGFGTQPYEQLAAVYQEAGQDTEARKVAIARRYDLRKYGNLSPYRKFGNWFGYWTIRYGYRTWRAGVALGALFLITLALSFCAQNHHLMVPVGDIEGLHSVPSATKCTSSYPCFYALGYTVDTVVPILNVHQAQYWGPDGRTPWGEAWVVWTWIATVFGWAFTTLLVVGYTGLVRQH